MNWINAKKKPIVNLEIYEVTGFYTWEENENTPDQPFLAAVETNKGWDIEKVIINDGGIYSFSEGEEGDYGWEIKDIDFYCLITPPIKEES